MKKKLILNALFVIIFVVAFCLLAVPNQGFGTTRDIQVSKPDGFARAIAATLSAWLPGQLRERGVPGAAVAVVGANRILWEKTWGVTHDPDSPPVTLDTIFNIRSVSKSVTALGVLMAVQEGLVDLDTPIKEYLPDFTVHSRFESHPENLLTLRNMLAHWASFTHDPPAHLSVVSAGSEQNDYFGQYIESIPDTWLRFPVGYRFEYANRGYDLAGYIIQKRSGQSFADYMKERVLDPIGMTNSSFDLGRAAQIKDRAIGHDSDGKVVPVAFPEVASGGLYTSIRDMCRYLQFHLNGGVVNGHRLLREDLMQQYHAIQFARDGQRTGYTLGLWREPIGNTFSLYHEGGGRGFGSHVIVYPELGIGTVLLTNREYHGLSGFEGRTVMNGPIVNRLGPIPIADPGLSQLRRIEMGDPRLESILGRYGDSPGVVVGYENGVLGLRRSGERFTALTVYDDGGEIVAMYGADSEIRFLPALGDQPGSLMFVSRVFSNHNSHYLDFNDSPADPPGPAKPAWQGYLGEYDMIWVDEPNSVVEINMKNGYLYYRNGKAKEIEPGLFIHYNGEVLDFRTMPPTYATQEIRKRAPLARHPVE